MSSRRLAHGLFVAGAALWLLAIAGWRWSARVPEPRSAERSGEIAPLAMLPESEIDSALNVTVDGNLFRLERSPVAAPATEPAVVTPPIRFRPALVLAGVVGGPPWSALLEGIPGREGPWVARAGDKLGELTVRHVAKDSVVVSAPDTTWRLTLRRFR